MTDKKVASPGERADTNNDKPRKRMNRNIASPTEKGAHQQCQAWEINEEKCYMPSAKGRTPTIIDPRDKCIEILHDQ